MEAVTPLVLGVIAAALSETDDNLRGKLRQMIVMLACFALASFSIELLFDLPLLFAAGLAISSFGFTMLGAIGSRYASIAFASLLVAVYTMLGADQSHDIVTQPLLLLSAAAWHSALTFIWYLLWPNHPLQQKLARLFRALESYLAAKANMFETIHGERSHGHRLELARRNRDVVAALNETKASLIRHAQKGRPSPTSNRYLQLYFVAQDIHERASSSHYRYDDLGKTFQFSDILFRFQRLALLQSRACRALSSAILSRQAYEHDARATQALEYTNASLAHLRAQQNCDQLQALTSLKFLLRNLTTIERLLADANNPNLIPESERALTDAEPHSLRDRWRRVMQDMKPSSQRFRHAVRIALALTVGYGVIQGLQLERGYWILLTILFVCQPNFSATRTRITQRMSGTVAGLLIGVPLLYLFPGQEGQLVLMVTFGVAFFATRTLHYGAATTFITLLVLMCFNQLGQGYAVILPRLADTLVGGVLSFLAVRYILPDWQIRHIPTVLARAIGSNREYLDQNIAQYRHGKRDSQAFRGVRRSAHNADADLSAAIGSMLLEPGRYQMAQDALFRMMVLNHSLLGYISALGAHRERIEDHEIHLLVNQGHRQIRQRLQLIEGIFTGQAQLPVQASEMALENRLGQWRDQDDDISALVLQQLFMIHRMLQEMTELAIRIMGYETATTTPEPTAEG